MLIILDSTSEIKAYLKRFQVSTDKLKVKHFLRLMIRQGFGFSFSFFVCFFWFCVFVYPYISVMYQNVSVFVSPFVLCDLVMPGFLLLGFVCALWAPVTWSTWQLLVLFSALHLWVLSPTFKHKQLHVMQVQVSPATICPVNVAY